MFEVRFMKKQKNHHLGFNTNFNLRITVLAEEWLKSIEYCVKPSTIQKYRGIVYGHIIPFFGNIKAKKITRTLVTEFGKTCLEKGLCEKTTNDILGVLRTVFRYAQQEYHLVFPEILFLREPGKDTRVLTDAEENRLLQYLVANMKLQEFGILLTLYTGLRIGELCALTWEDISDTSIQVTKTIQRLKGKNGKTTLVAGTPKTVNSKRKIPIASCVQPYIALFRKETGFVLQTKNQTPTEPRTLQAKFKKIANHCHLNNVTFHTLRHTFATRCVESGFDPKSLSEILGHRDVKTTLHLYVHPSFDYKRENIEKLKTPDE